MCENIYAGKQWKIFAVIEIEQICVQNSMISRFNWLNEYIDKLSTSEITHALAADTYVDKTNKCQMYCIYPVPSFSANPETKLTCPM